MSESDALGDILEYIDSASATDKAAYLTNLQVLENRLADVEKFGYRPHVENVNKECHRDSMLPAQKNDRIESKISAAAAVSSTSQLSKKKKKQQQRLANTKSPPPEAIETSTSAISNSTPSIVGDEDLTDPVAVALLGMGFTDDQIKSAARALGGFERATADDMVVWILGEGETADSGNTLDTAESQAATQSKAQKKVASKTGISLKTRAEEAARKHQEELAAAKRAAEKREEQRRIRREWNEREQARQMQEKNAKIAEATTRRQQEETAKLMADTALFPMALGNDMGMGIPPSAPVGSVVGGVGKKQHNDAGPPLTIFAGGPKAMANAKSKKHASNMGIPQAPAVLRTPKILTRPLNPTLPVESAYTQPLSHGIVGNQPLFAPHPTSMNAKPTGGSPPRNIYAKQIHPSGINHRADQPTAILRKEPSAAVTNQNINMSGSSSRRILPQHPGHHHMHAGLALNDPDSLAVSSSIMASSASNPVPFQGVAPPGFISSSIAQHHLVRPSSKNDVAAGAASSASSFDDTNPLGMIRATAREFVPTYFKPSSTSPTPDSFLPDPSNTVPSMSAQFMSARPSMASSSPPPLPPTRTTSNDDAENVMFEHMSSMLSNFGAESNTPTVQSATSSITGPSGMMPANNNNNNNNNTGDDNNTTSRVGSIMTFESTTAPNPGGPFAFGGNGIQTSSIFESISYHGDQESNNLALGSGGGIWGTGGSSSNVNQNSSMGLAGLNFSSFMGGV